MKIKSRAKKFFAILMSVAMVISMMPAMAFAEPAAGSVATETTLIISGVDSSGEAESADEGATLKLKATVHKGESASVNEGSVTFYNGEESIGTLNVNTSGATDEVEFVVPLLEGTASTLKLKAVYNGTANYIKSDSSEHSVTVKSVYIKNESAKLKCDPNLEVGKESELSLEGIVKNSSGTVLDGSTDYTVEYYENTGDGVWTKVTGNMVKPVTDAYTYMARVLPKGTYTQGAFETDPVGIGNVTKLNTEVTTVTKVSNVTIYQNKPVTYKATVKAGKNNAAGGTVSFYYYRSAGGADPINVFVATVPVFNGEAVTNIAFPEGDKNYKVKAVYSGNSVYTSSFGDTVNNQFCRSTTLNPKTLVLTANGNAENKINVGAENTLSLAVGQANYQSTIPYAYTLGTDYIVVWQSNDGNGWLEFARTESGDMTVTVTPDSDQYSYRAVLFPKGNYIAPANGVVSNAVSATEKVATTTTLTASEKNPFEESDITLNAVVKYGDQPASGIVQFYHGDVFIGDAYIDSMGNASLLVTVPEYTKASAAEITYTAKYLENNTYSASDGSDTVTVIPAQIRTDGGSKKITITPETGGSLTVGEEYTLTIPAVFSRGKYKIRLTSGTDYVVQWYVSTDGGKLWNVLGNSGDSITVTPADKNSTYKAEIKPIGNYKKAWDGEKVVDYLTMNSVGSSTSDTVVTLTADPESCKEGADVNLNVQVTTGADKAVTSGVVKVYRYVDGSTGDIEIGYKDLDSKGKAVINTKAPTEGTGDYCYYAVYEGTESYSAFNVPSNEARNSWVAKITVSSNRIVTAGYTKEITIDPSESPLTVNKKYTLTIPEIFEYGVDQTSGSKLTYGTDYEIQWQVSYDNGNIWNNVGNTGDKIDVKPENINAQYKAIVKPIGEYKGAVVEIRTEKKGDDDGFGTGEYEVTYENVTELVLTSVTSQVAATTTELTVKNTAEQEEGNLTEYEGEYVTLEAVVKGVDKVGGENPLIPSGYIYFYKNGVKINNIAVEVVNGVATLEAVMSSYDTAKSAAENKDVFTAEYVANSSYGASQTTDGVNVLIRSTKIDVPVIEVYNSKDLSQTYGTTVDGEINGLPAGTPITFSLTGDVKALDGRELKDGTDYTFQWEQNSNKGMFVDVAGAVENKYSIDNGKDKDSFRLTLKPIGHMTVGSTSKTATIGNLADPKVSINVTSPYTTTFEGDTYSGSHYGDEVTLTATVKGDSALPTGVVSFWYNDGSSASIQIGDYVVLEKSTTPGETNTAKAKISTTALPEGALDIYVKYHGDSTFKAEDDFTALDDNGLDDDAVKELYKVWSTEIANDRTVDDGPYLDISVTGKNGTPVTGGIGTLDAGSTYELTLTSDVYTNSGQLLKDDEFVIEWQQSENGVDWEKVPGSGNSKSCTVKPENENMQYRAQVTTTYELFAPPLETVPTRLDTECSNVIGCDPQAVEINVTTDKSSAAAPYTDAVYEGNEITLYAEVIPTDSQHTKAVGGKVEFYYAVCDEENNHEVGSLVKIPSSDPKDGGSNQANVVERDGKYFAAITTTAIPANSEAKMQKLIIFANYLGDGTYKPFIVHNPEKVSPDTRHVTVYSSTLYSDAAIQNQIIDDPSSAPPAVVIYAPEDVLVADGSPTVLTLKNLYTLDAEDGYKTTPITAPGEYTYLTESINYTVQWQYTTALNVSKPEDSSWLKLDAVGHQATVSPQAGYAYRAVVTVDQTAERTVKSQKTYYSNILEATSADAVLQVRAIPTSSGGFKDTNLVFDAYVSGGTTVPVGEITLKLDGTLGGKLERSATAVNGQVKFGAGIGDTKGVINLPADVYTMTASYKGNNGYKIETNAQTYIVRYKANEVAVKVNEYDYAGLVYDGTIQRPDSAAVTFNGGTGHAAAQKKADASVVYNYEMKKGNDWVAVDAPFDAGEYRVTAVLPESIYYEAQQSNPYTFEIAQKPISISDILVQAKIYDGTKNANILDVELDGVVAGDSVYTKGGAATASEKALVTNTVTYTATGLLGPDAGNYKFAANGDSKSEAFTIARNLVTVDSSAIAKTNLEGMKVYDNYGTDMAKGTDYTVRYFFHDGSGVKETSNLNKVGKYTVIVAPKDTANYKGGESFVMNVAEGNVVTFTGNDAAAPVKPGVISITGTQQLWNAKSITAAASNGNTATAVYNVTVNKAGRYGVTATADGCGDTHGILTVYKAEASHIIPVVNDKVYDGEAVTVSNVSDYPASTYFTYTGGEIIGISYDAPKDAGEYTVTAHVPATDTTVAYAETRTFEITKKPITVKAISVTKQVYRTNPDLRAEYEGLVTGDSDIKDMLVLPSFALRTADSENIDVNNVGNYTIVPSGAVSKNYEVTQYNNGNFAVQTTDPASTMNIVGLPYGQVYYGDEFRVSVYGNVGQRVDKNGTYNNPSSVISWFVSDGSDGWTQDNGNVTIDSDGNVKIKGAKAADFTIRAERGTGDYKIYAEYDVDVEKRPVYISMKGEDSKVYNGSNQNVDVSKYVVSGALTDITLTLANLDPNTGRDVDEYIITASYSDDKYVGAGKGLMTITPKPAVVTSNDNLSNVYGTTPSIADNAYTVSGACGSDAVITTANTRSDVRFNNDVGNYEIFTAGVENKNYDVSYESGKYGVVAKTLTAKSGVDDETVINTIINQVKRAYGVVNPQMGYDVKDMITGDSLADFAVSSNFVVYNRVQEDNANVVGSANNESALTAAGEYVNGYGASDNYGRIDLDDTFANVNANALNYTITPADGVLDIYQSNVTIDVQNLTVKTGTTLSDSSYYAVVYRVLTEAPMNDTLADLRLHYTPLGIAGSGYCVTGTNIDVSLESGSTELPPAISLSDYFAQNYYALSVDKGDLKVRDKAANAVITPDKDSVTVTTTVPNPEGGTTLVNVGDIDYVVIDKNGNKKAYGTMATDPSKVGTYADDPYGTIVGSLEALPNGNYTILLDPKGTEYALEPTYKDFTVGGGTVTPTPGGGGGGGGGVVTPPVLIKDDHFAYMQGDDNGNFRPDANLTRAEAATIFYNLLVDKSMGSSKTDFTDVKGNEWYATAVETLASRGILGGYEDGSFRPSNNITRAEFAAIASRFDDLSTGTVTFKDVTPDHWAYNYIVSAATKGWITGYEDNTFRPENNITRAEVVTLVNRVLDRVPDKDYIDKNIDDIKVLKDVTKAHWAYYNIIEATNGHDYTKDSKGNETWKKLK